MTICEALLSALFTLSQTSLERLSNLPKIIKLINDWTKVCDSKLHSLNHFSALPIFEWNQEITFSGMEDALKNTGIRVQKDKAETGVVYNFLFCDNKWENQLRDIFFLS